VLDLLSALAVGQSNSSSCRLHRGLAGKDNAPLPHGMPASSCLARSSLLEYKGEGMKGCMYVELLLQHNPQGC
jgi:hypothetical protein